jgi:translation elongation factor EF-4
LQAARSYHFGCSGAQLFWREQKEGRKTRQFGKVDIPQEAFIAALKVDS